MMTLPKFCIAVALVSVYSTTATTEMTGDMLCGQAGDWNGDHQTGGGSCNDLLKRHFSNFQGNEQCSEPTPQVPAVTIEKFIGYVGTTLGCCRDGKPGDTCDNSGTYTGCIADKCKECAEGSVQWPAGWGTSPTIDLPFLQKSKAGAECVNCICESDCADFQDFQGWASREKGCPVAAETIAQEMTGDMLCGQAGDWNGDHQTGGGSCNDLLKRHFSNFQGNEQCSEPTPQVPAMTIEKFIGYVGTTLGCCRDGKPGDTCDIAQEIITKAEKHGSTTAPESTSAHVISSAMFVIAAMATTMA